MAEHEYAQVLRWIADGKEIQCSSSTNVNIYKDVTHQRVLHAISIDCAVPPDRFRLKPRTIMIGDVECEAPVLEPEEGQRLYWTNSDGDVIDDQYYKIQNDAWIIVAKGRAFASEEAASAAHNAITKLLTQGAENA